ncbi:hypothetical protein AC249_AIPGENE1395 [Exaiptasia diaphana]|nr:hypothetical protein AC249_AIPGENE1395 [Exaiptasia diaphana]
MPRFRFNIFLNQFNPFPTAIGQCPAYAPNIVEKQGSRLYGHVITWLYAEKEILCRLKCNMIEKCLTINYNSAKEICELNDGDDLKDLRPSQGFVYIDMKVRRSDLF